MNPKRTVLALAVLAAAVAIPLGTSATAAAGPLRAATPMAAMTPMSAAFGSAAHDTAARAGNTDRIDCDFGDFGGDASGNSGSFDAGGSGLLDEGLSGDGLGGPGLVSGSTASSGTSIDGSSVSSGGLIDASSGPLTSGSAATFGG